MNRNYAKITLVALFLLTMFWGCKTSQKVISDTPTIQNQNIAQKDLEPDSLYFKLKENELKFNTLSVKFSAKAIINKKETSVSGLLRIQADSLIWVSITPALGIEAVRVLIVDDTIKILNRLDGSCTIASFAYLSEITKQEMDFDMLQALILGNDFSYYDNTKFTASVEKQGYKLNTLNRRKLKRAARKNETMNSIPYQYMIMDFANYKIKETNLESVNENNYKFSATYQDFVEIEKQLVPTKLTMQAEAAADKFQLRANYSKIQINPEPIGFPFRIPDSYEVKVLEK